MNKNKKLGFLGRKKYRNFCNLAEHDYGFSVFILEKPVSKKKSVKKNLNNVIKRKPLYR